MKQLLSEILVNQKLLTEEQLKVVLEKTRSSHKTLGELLVELNYLQKPVLKEILKKSCSKILHQDFDSSLLTLFPPDFLHTNKIFPLRKEEGKVILATTNTQRFDLIDNLQFFLKDAYQLVLCDQESIENALREAFPRELSQENGSLQRNNGSQNHENLSSNRFIEAMIQNAFQQKVSDIHIEPFKNRLRLRYRVDGLLYERKDLPFDLKNSIISRIKLISGMDISEKRFPQDGKMIFSFEGEDFSLRVSCIPSLYGESLALRILDKSKGDFGFDQLGLLKTDQQYFEKMMHLSNGLILISGPTGSGKTTTLYALLNQLKKLSQKIITIEDPVEYQMSEISQVNVNVKIHLTFALILKAVLRQSPNVIMIGEIRDTETAHIAVQAALTGHLVLSTLHTNTVSSAVVRLFDMGVFPYKVASALRAVVAQRLVRKLCVYCKQSHRLSSEEKEAFAFLSPCPSEIFREKGCQLCFNTGYLGRLGIFQIMFINDVLRENIYKKDAESLIKENLHKRQIADLWEDGLKKVALGLTSIEEVKRVVDREV